MGMSMSNSLAKNLMAWIDDHDQSTPKRVCSVWGVGGCRFGLRVLHLDSTPSTTDQAACDAGLLPPPASAT